jgi:2-dehydropantoate 2-reductase
MVRIGVIGAGAIGGALAASLDRAGHDVEVAARGAQLDAIRTDGLRLDGGWGEHLARVEANPALSRVPDLALVTTKAQDTAAALEGNADLIPAIPLVVVQNGLGGMTAAHRVLPRSPVLGGLALLAASYLSPGRVTVTNPQPVVLGVGPESDDALLERIAGVLGAAFPVETTGDLEGAQWTKLLVNHVNALPALTDLSVQEVVSRPRLLRIMASSVLETALLADRWGVRFADLMGFEGDTLQAIGRGSGSVAAAEDFLRALAGKMGDVPNPASTLQSIRRGQQTEIDFLNGAVVAAARERGLDAPLNAALVDLVHEVERSRRFLTEDELIRRLG